MRLAVPGAFSCLEKNDPIVTSSRTLAAVAYQQFSRAQLSAGNESWQRPEIYTFDAWLTSVWQEARYDRADVPMLLSPQQEQVIWQHIIAQHAPGLFDLSATARLARDAADLVCEACIPLDHEAWAEQHDAQQFRFWFAEFRKRCRAEGWMARREILSCLRPAPTPVFIGFDEPPAASARTLPFVFSHKKPNLPLRKCESLQEELDLGARWARTRFEAAPNESIAVFVPNLRLHRTLVERTFADIFYPGRAARFDVSAADSVFHISAPQPLLEHPLISNALLLLELSRPRIAQSDAAAILRSPFLGDAEPERSLRAQADLNLRRTRELEVSLREMEWASRDCPRMVHVWQRVRSVLSRRENRMDLPRWSRFFADLLHAAGWPGDMELSAREQQVVEMWKDTLSSLSALGNVSPALTLEPALGHLKRLLTTGGLERGDWLSPVQILDAADAAGLEFDSVFVAGLGDETWPVPDRLSPLVPLKLQPDATAANLRQRSLDATRALVQSAPVMAGSYTGRLAPQVRACAKIKSFDQDAWSGKRPLDSFVAATLDEAREISGPPFDTSQEARGGTSIIKAQSQCPFRAFATYRLKARPLDDASFGFDPLDRGTFLHNALQRVWQKLGDHAALRAASEDELREIIHAAVQASVKEAQQSGFYMQTTQVEQQRLEALILEWLITIERPRTVPFTVEATENELHIKLGGLPLHVRIDRVDRLQNGGLVLIDYKSGGEVNKNKLRGECPAEPQLLVYAAAESRRVEGLLFGYVAPRDLAMKGLTRSKILDSRTVEGCDREWDTFLEEARDEVKRLAADFVRGHALVDPAKNACTYCELAPLCRKNERICGEDAE